MKTLIICVILSIFVCGSMARTFAILSQNTEPVVLLIPTEEDNDQPQQLIRQKRQFGFGRRGPRPQGFGQSSAQANANAFNNHFGPNGFGASNSLAGAQSFNSQGPLGGFGASAANSASQGFNCGIGGCSGNAGASGSQSYNLPGGRTVSVAFGNGFNVAPGQKPTFTNNKSIAFT